MMNHLCAMLISSPMGPVRIFDGSVPPVEPAWGGWVWVIGGAWCVAMSVVGWIAVRRHVNRKGAAARLVKRAAGWRGLDGTEVKLLSVMAAESKEVDRDELVLAMLLMPKIAAAGLDRAWDRTEGVKRARLITLRGKLGVLEAERSGRLLEDGGGSGATIPFASSPSSRDGGAA